MLSRNGLVFGVAFRERSHQSLRRELLWPSLGQVRPKSRRAPTPRARARPEPPMNRFVPGNYQCRVGDRRILGAYHLALADDVLGTRSTWWIAFLRYVPRQTCVWCGALYPLGRFRRRGRANLCGGLTAPRGRLGSGLGTKKA